MRTDASAIGPAHGWNDARCLASLHSALLQAAAAFDIASVRSKPSRENQYEEDDQDDADDTNAAVTIAVAVAPEAATKAPEQEDDEDDNEYESERHDLSPTATPKRH